MYYLQSRYYDPIVGRFVNGDDAILTLLSNSILEYNIFSYCENNITIKTDSNGFAATYTYGGITCTKTRVGLDVKHHYKFCLKTFCRTYAQKVIQKWGKNGKYCSMNTHRIATEIFAHEVLFILGKIVGTLSIWNFVYAWKAKPFLQKVSSIIIGVIYGKISQYLVSHSTIINVNYNESWYRETAFEVIWAFFSPKIW